MQGHTTHGFASLASEVEQAVWDLFPVVHTIEDSFTVDGKPSPEGLVLRYYEAVHVAILRRPTQPF